jgi:hypothetical protein
MRRVLMVAVFGVICGGVLHADVSSQEKSQVKFAGALGRMMNLFGGRAAREGVVSTVAVQGDRKVSRTDDREEIVDLKEEKVYAVNLKDKSYTVTTFADMRRQMEEARRKAAEQQAKQGDSTPQSGQPQKEVDIDFSLKESGQKKMVNGFDAHEVVMTIAVREKGKTLEQSGGLVMTNNIWLAPRIAAMKEIADFDRRYAEKLALPTTLDAQQMAAVLAMYPMMSEAMKRFEKENVSMDGTPVLTVTTVDAVASAEQAAAAAKEEPKSDPAPRSLGGLAGRLARRAANREPEPAANADPNRATFMTMQHEVVSVSPTVAAADLQIPAGFKEKK